MQITTLLGTRYPLIQCGMAWVSDAKLAAAVSKAGALGVIAAGNAPASWVKEQIDALRAETDAPFALNIMLLSPYADEVAQLAIDEKVPVAITGAGDPRKHIAPWKEAGIKVIPVVPSLSLAKRMEQAGADAVIVEGMEAGGHIGKLTTMVLVNEIARELSIPVIAAGGICDARSVAAACMLGADGVQVGTRFLVAKECNIHQNYKDLVLKAKDIDSMVAGQVTGHPVRAIRNPLVKKLNKLDREGGSMEDFEALSTGSLQRAAVEGDKKTGSFMAGQCAAMVDSEQTVKEIIEDLFNQSEIQGAIDHLKEMELLS